MTKLETGKITEITAGIRRLLAPNPGPFTGPGTNTYIIGREQIAVIDPGPANPRHIENLLAAVGPRIKWILTTHTHGDHSPGVRLILDKVTQPVQVIGVPAPEGVNQDQGFCPDTVVKDGYVLSCDEFTLEAIHTPGHASNHMCYLLREDKYLFIGDHLMQGSSVIIAPPDGDMTHYLQSLEKLFHYDIEFLAPAHGHIMDQPEAIIGHAKEHRLMRERKVFENLKSSGEISLADLTKPVYDDVPEFMHPAAQQSLKAHLLRFAALGIAEQKNDNWLLREGAVL